MSLLMDALKKAELAQRKVQQENASASVTTHASTTDSPPAAGPAGTVTAASTLSIQPAPEASASIGAASALRTATQGERLSSPMDRPSLVTEEFTSRQLPSSLKSTSTSFSLEEIDTPATSISRAADSTQETENAQQRETIQNLFETKQTGPSRKTFAIVVGTTTILAVLAIGLYFWIALQPKPGLQPAVSLKPFPQLPAMSAQPAATMAPMDSGSVDASPAASRSLLAARQEETKREAFAANDRQPPAPPVKKVFQVTTAPPLSNSMLDRAYDALTRGDDASSKAAYERVLGTDPKNIDALSGLAVIAQRSGNPARAADYYLQILDADPKNPVALGGLINLQSRMDPEEAETRIKQALSTQPDSPALNFSLGNVYARSKRWSEAQQSYFKATTVDPSNPDYLFNLAVSLEQLRQPRLAATYYAQAIAAAETRPGSFDKTKAGERLQQLQQ